MLKVETLIPWLSSPLPELPDRAICTISICMCDGGQTRGNLLRVLHLISMRSLFFGVSVVSGSLPPHRLQHARLPCSSPSPRACSNSCPLSRWCHPTISSSVTSFLLLPLIFHSIRVFSNAKSWLFALDGQSITEVYLTYNVVLISVYSKVTWLHTYTYIIFELFTENG